MRDIFIIYGGPTSEREVSFDSKNFFIDLYEKSNPKVTEWKENFNFVFENSEYNEEDFYPLLKRFKPIVIIASHGEYVEDGYLQYKLEENGIEFTGSDSISCALAMNKAKSQKIASAFVKTIPTYTDKPSKFKWKRMVKTIGNDFPIFIKPNNRGSSVGAFVINSKKELKEKLNKLDDITYLFQPFIKGKEVSVGSVRRNKSGFFKLPLTEIFPIKADFFDYNEKYSADGAKELTPANIDKELSREIRRNANAIHDALGLGYYSRSDFIITETNTVYYLETNPLPGMSKTSILPQQLRHSNNLRNFKRGLMKFTVRK